MAHFLLIHGSCHGAWCWRDTIPALEALGHTAHAIDLPGHGADPTPRDGVTLEAYARAIRAAVDRPTIIVGHSMGGYPITAAAELDPANIAALVYLCAYRPVSGLSLGDMRRAGPRQPLRPAIRVEGAVFTFDPAMWGLFYHDCPAETVAWALAQQTPQPIVPQETALELTERSQAVPQFYIRCADDRAIPPDYQLTMAEGLPDGRLSHLAASHSPFLSMPGELAARLGGIAAAL
ncbi:alpha/beta fold hydrolase [Gemmobacter sp.]|uniref:alpha/beta fold hydrolase n=1 Tax=Gemmobacter sp. TaxID=1898957 RepID=UPI002AFF83C2|nr:alpha/beta fold hydrolase [Gemmobacter sp.]